MRVTTLSLFLLAGQVHALEVVSRTDFEKDKGVFERAGNVAVSEQDPYEGAGRCLLYRTDKSRIGFSTGFREPISFKDLRVSFCIRLIGVKGLGQNWPAAEPRDNTYAKAVANRIAGKLHTGWPAETKRNVQEDGRWGTVTLELYENRFNSNHVLINPEMHSCRGVSFHSANVSPGREASVAIDNFALYRGEDGTPPGAISDLSAGASGGVVELVWSRPEDDLFAVRYEVYRAASPSAGVAGEDLIATAHRLRFRDAALVNPGTYYYRVVARDFAGNRSAGSNVAVVILDDDGEPVSGGQEG